jgi:3-phosphoshikimate 1-carboxyvinyltransferase
VSEITIHPKKKVTGNFTAPCSKSYAQRAIAMSSLCKKAVTLKNYSENEDTIAALSVLQAFGGEYQIKEKDLFITKGIDLNAHKKFILDVGEAGLSTRLFSAFSLLFDSEITITGHGSILQRPMDMVIDVLTQFDKQVISTNGFLPLTISGKTIPKTIEMDGSESSQLLTGLLIVLPLLNCNSVVHVRNLKSIPYIDMTLEILSDFGISISHTNYSEFNIKGNQSPSRNTYYIEGDWSGASFFAVAAAIGGELTLSNLHKFSSQADKAILIALEKAGVSIQWLSLKKVFIQKNQLHAFEFDATNCPDLFPPLVALAANCNGATRIKGLNRLANKESNRGVTLMTEFQKVNVEIELDYPNDTMIIHGKKKLYIPKNTLFDSHHDHRIAMAVALLAINANTAFGIQNPESVKKSFPGFFEEFASV